MKISSKALVVAALIGSLAPVFPQAPVATPAPADAAIATPAPQTNRAAARPGANPRRPAARLARTETPPELQAPPLVAPEPGVARQGNVNVRGQAAMNSEVITRLDRGHPVIVLEEITLKKPKEDEPARWYRISLPTNVAVWVHSAFIDASTKTVKPRRLNLRGGPGENYSVVGRLDRGAAVTQVDAKGDWLKIEPPTNSFGFVAAHLIQRTPAPAIVAAPLTPPKTNEVAAVPPPTTTTPVPATTTPAVAEAPATTPPVVATTPTPAIPAPVEPAPATPVETVRKIVSREGVLKGTVSIQAPSYFALRSLDTGKTIDYVHSPSTNLNLGEFKGQRIIVTGEEVLDERWPNTPVLIVESLQTVP